jgi:hypothetical protein
MIHQERLRPIVKNQTQAGVTVSFKGARQRVKMVGR